MKTLIISILIFGSLNAYSQNNTETVNVREMLNTDVFIVEMNVDTIYPLKKIRLMIGNKKESFKLYHFLIDSVYYVADKTILNPKEIIGPKIVIVPYEVKIHRQGLIFASIFSTSQKDVFVWSRFLPKHALIYKDLWYHSIIKSIDLKSRKLTKYLKVD